MTSIPQMCVTNWLTRCWLMVYILPLNVPMTQSSRRDHFRKRKFRKVKWLSQDHIGHSSSGQRSQVYPPCGPNLGTNHSPKSCGTVRVELSACSRLSTFGEVASVVPHTHPTQNQDMALESNPHTTSPLPKTRIQKSKESGFIVLKALLHLSSLLMLKINIVSQWSTGIKDKEDTLWEFDCCPRTAPEGQCGATPPYLNGNISEPNSGHTDW